MLSNRYNAGHIYDLKFSSSYIKSQNRWKYILLITFYLALYYKIHTNYITSTCDQYKINDTLFFILSIETWHVF